MSWYHNAVFYQALVGSFKADGDKEVGTLRGVIDKLDYLQSVSYTHLTLPTSDLV